MADKIRAVHPSASPLIPEVRRQRNETGMVSLMKEVRHLG